jgi:hypothetical protein
LTETERPPARAKVGPPAEDTFSWKKVIMQFAAINFMFGVVILGYLKWGYMKEFVQTRFRRKKPNG